MNMTNKHNGKEYEVLTAFQTKEGMVMALVQLPEAIYVDGLLTRIAAFPRNDFLPADGEFAEIIEAKEIVESQQEVTNE